MLNRLILLLASACFCLGATGAVLPPEKLLPKDTDLVITVPDWAAAHDLVTNSPYGRLWHDPVLKPFKDKFVDKFTSDVIAPLEKSLGVQFSSYQGLVQGQMTFALLPMANPSRPEDRFARIFILDSKDHAGLLRTNLDDIKKRWAAAGKPMKSSKIRELDFTTLILSSDDLSWSKLTAKAGNPDDNSNPPSTNKSEITFGQSDSLLLVSDSPALLEKVLSRQAGGLVPALDENPVFQNDYGARLHGAPIYAWANISYVLGVLTGTTPEGEDSGPVGGPDSPLSALGLNGLTSASITYRSTPEGLAAQLFIGAPEAKRRGLAKAFAIAAKDANPPSFVPADAAKYWRWRIDIPHAWTQIEAMLTEFNPQYASVINFILNTAGKDKDEKYDLKSELLSTLGDDIIHYEKVPNGKTLAELNSAPSIYLIGSPNAAKLAAALKTGLGFMGVIKDREFLGRKINTLTSAAQPGAPTHSFSFAASGSYVALSGDAGILEEFLRSNDNPVKPLNATPGLSDAAQKVGGMGTGLFGFENQSLSMRSVVETLRGQPVTLQDILGAPSMVGTVNTGDQVAKLRAWADFSLLPPYDAISQYFYFSVFSGSFSPDGFTMNYFSPTPPKLR
jgi:hypothetical protein